MRFLLCMITVMGIFATFAAHATSCRHSTCKEYLIRHDLVFKGKAVASGASTPEMQQEFNKKKNPELRGELPDTYTDFEVTKLYKGVAEKKVRIYYSAHRRGPIIGDFDVKAYPDGQEVTIYATRAGGFYIVYRGLCSGCGGEEELATIRAQYDAIDELIQKSPQVLEFYTKKAALYEEYRDYAAAAVSYEQAFAKVPGAKDNQEFKARYGRMLQLAGEPEKAVKVLEGIKNAPGVATDMQLSLLQMGRSAELSGQKLAMAGQELSNITIKDADISGSDFSGAKLNNVKFINVTLQNAVFTKAQMSVEISDSKLGGAKFDEAKVRGNFLNSNFDKASFVKTEMELRTADRNSFKGADFSSGKVYISECTMQPKDWEGNDFTNARFRDATFGGLHKSKITGADLTGMKFHTNRCRPQNQGVDLSGLKLDGTQFDHGDYSGATFKGASLKGASFAGATLTDVDFRDADLTGAAFTIASYSGPVKVEGADFTNAKLDGTKWAGAIFDCKTKFPAGFKPEEHQMETRDRSCETGVTKNPGVIDYDWERLVQGYMTICNGDYHADCIYGFLASFVVKQKDWGYERELGRLAESFLEAGYPNLAKTIALKSIGGTALSRHSLDPKYFDKWLPLMEKIEDAEQGRKSPRSAAMLGVDANPSAKGKTLMFTASGKLWKGDGMSAEKLADAARSSAESGDLPAALSYAEKIGSAEFNSETLGWPADGKINESVDPNREYFRERQEYTSALTSIALERQRRGQDAAAIQANLDAATRLMPKKKSDDRETIQLAALTVLTGGDLALPDKSYYYLRGSADQIAAAYAETGKIDKAWEIYGRVGGDSEQGPALSVLSAIADYYISHPDTADRKKLVGELKKYATERWPQRGEMIYAGFEVGVLSKFFDIIGRVKAPEILEDILSRTEAYTDETLKAHTRLYAATAFARMGKTAQAFDYFEKCRKTLSDTPPPEGRRMPRHIIMLSPGGSASMKTQPLFLRDEEIGHFIFTLAISEASEADKQKALKAGQELLASGKAGSPMFRAQLAIATAAVLKDKDSGQAMKDAQYGVPPSAFAELLHRAGFHEAEKKLIEVAWASGGAPPGIGLERLGFRTGYMATRHGMQLAQITGMLARDGHFDAAEQAARTIVHASAVHRVGGTSYIAYFTRQKVLYDIAISALQQKKTDIALDIVKSKMTYQPYQAGVYFALAKTAFDEKRNKEALELYNKGHDMTPSFGDAMGAPLLDPDGLAVEALVDRAAAEKKLGLAQNYDQTLSFARQVAGMAENDVQRGRTSSVVDRIAQLGATGEAQKQSVEEFIKSLKINDDLNSTSVVAEMAEKYLKEGDKERARAVAMYGFRNIGNYPQASGKVTVLLPYASIIARTEPRMSDESQMKIEAILRQVHSNLPGGKAEPEAVKSDFVAEGSAAYAELRRRRMLDDAPPNKGDVLTQLERDGSIQRGGEALMREWLAGAVKKYNAANPGKPISGNVTGNGDTSYMGYKVITKEITFPTQQYGGAFNDRLVVPKDVPRPKGQRHDTTIFYLSDFTCEGNFPPFCKY